jgi:hypothetical protein
MLHRRGGLFLSHRELVDSKSTDEEREEAPGKVKMRRKKRRR